MAKESNLLTELDKMNDLDRLIHVNGDWIQHAIDILYELKPAVVLPSLGYDIHRLEEYVKAEKTRLINELKDKFNQAAIQINQYNWNETGDLVIFDNYFFDFYLGLKCDLKTFPKIILKVSNDKLLLIHKAMVTKPDFRSKLED